MDTRLRLGKLKKFELQALAGKLNLENFAYLNNEELISLIIEKSTPEDIEAALQVPPEKPPKGWKKNLKSIGFWGSIASIVGILITLLIVFFPVQKDSDDLAALKAEIRKKISDPMIIQEYEKKLDETVKALKELKEGDKRAREEALAEFRKGNFSLAQELFAKQREKEKLRQKEFAETAYNLGNTYYLQLKYKEALEAYKEAESLEPGNAEYKNSIGYCQFEIGNYKEAKGYFEKCLEFNRKTYGETHEEVATSWNNLGGAYYSLGQYDTAVQYHIKALALRIKIYGESHPDVAQSWNNLGEAYRALGQYETAIQYHKKTLNLRKKIYGESHPDVAQSWNNLGEDYRALGQYETAIQYHKKAMEIFTKVYGEAHPSSATSWNNLGYVYYKLGQYETAIQYYQKALEIFTKVYGEAHPSVATGWNNLGFTYASLGQYETAIQYYQKALPIFEKFLGNGHPNTKLVRQNLEKAMSKRK